MTRHLPAPSEGFGRSPEQVFIETRGHGSVRMTGYMRQSNGMQTIPGVLLDAVPINYDDSRLDFDPEAYDDLPLLDSDRDPDGLVIGQRSSNVDRKLSHDYDSTKLVAGPTHGEHKSKVKR